MMQALELDNDCWKDAASSFEWARINMHLKSHTADVEQFMSTVMQVFILRMCTSALKQIIVGNPNEALKSLNACKQCSNQFFNPNDLIVK